MPEMTDSYAGSTDPGTGQLPCPACGSSNQRGFRFCGTCGATLGRICASCGAEVPPEFRFCGVCGSPQVAGDARAEPELEERKVVTVLFADLTGSTELAARP